MNNSLTKVFVDRGIIAARTEIDAPYKGMDMAGFSVVRAAGTFLILSVAETPDGYLFECADTIDGSRRTIHSGVVVRIDGMDPERLAANYGLSPTGEKLKLGKRRGRKPKIPRPEEDEG